MPVRRRTPRELAAAEAIRSAALRDRLLNDAEAIRSKGKAAVEVNSHLAWMREAPQKLPERTKEIAEQMAAVQADAALPEDQRQFTDAGRERKLQELRDQVDQVIADVRKEFAGHKQALLDGWPLEIPAEVPMSDADFRRTMVALQKVDGLTAAQLLTELQEAVARQDAHVVRPLLDAFQARVDRGDEEMQALIDSQTMGDDEVTHTLRLAEAAVLSLQVEPWKAVAYERSRQVADHAEAEFESAIRQLRETEGREIVTQRFKPVMLKGDTSFELSQRGDLGREPPEGS